MTTTIDEAKLEAFMGRAVADLAAAESSVACYIGDRLGLYRAMAKVDWLTAAELAAATGTNERLVTEWLHNQVAGEYVEHDSGSFRLPAEHATVLADPQSPTFLGGIFQIVASMWADVEQAEAAFRGDGGIDWGARDSRLYDGVDRLFAPIYRAYLVSEWLPELDGVVDRLRAGGKVADVGCGFGSSTIVLSEAFPEATVIGYDYHSGSLDVARRRAKEASLDDRPRFELVDAVELGEGGFDLICFFDALHDMGDPVSAAAAARRSLAPGGALMAVEPKAADELDDNISPANRLFYAGSTFLCTPSALAQGGGVALGGQAGPTAITQVLRDAGFEQVRVATETPFNHVFEAR